MANGTAPQQQCNDHEVRLSVMENKVANLESLHNGHETRIDTLEKAVVDNTMAVNQLTTTISVAWKAIVMSIVAGVAVLGWLVSANWLNIPTPEKHTGWIEQPAHKV